MKKDLKVIYFSNSYTSHDRRFLSYLSKQGFRVFFLTLESDNSIKEDRFLPENVEILTPPNAKFNKISMYKFVSHLKKYIRKINPDIIHAGPLQTCAYITSLTNFHPFVAMSWGSDLLIEADKTKSTKNITRKVLASSDAFIGDCDTVKDKALAFGVKANKISIFPWGIDLNKFPNQKNSKIRDRLGWQDNFIIMHSRSWEAIYNVENFIKGFIAAYKKNNNLRLLLLGNGSFSTKIKSLIHGASLQNVVHFAGHVSQDTLPEYYQSADLYVSASLSDGSSVSLMESLASGLPCLVSDIPSNREWVTPNKQGWLFNPMAINDISDGILNAAQTDDLTNLQKLTRNTAEEKADWQNNSQGILKAYKIAIEGVA